MHLPYKTMCYSIRHRLKSYKSRLVCERQKGAAPASRPLCYWGQMGARGAGAGARIDRRGAPGASAALARGRRLHGNADQNTERPLGGGWAWVRPWARISLSSRFAMGNFFGDVNVFFFFDERWLGVFGICMLCRLLINLK